MATFTKTEEHFIQHEVQLRINDHKFDDFEKRMDRMDHKLNLIIGIVIGSIVIPIALHYLHLS